MHPHPLCHSTLVNTSSYKVVSFLSSPPFRGQECHTLIFYQSMYSALLVLTGDMSDTQLFVVVLCVSGSKKLIGCASLAFLTLSLSGAHGAILLRI